MQEQGSRTESLDTVKTELGEEQNVRSSRPVKRLRSNHALEGEHDTGVGTKKEFITTLRDAAPGTPRRRYWYITGYNGKL